MSTNAKILSILLGMLAVLVVPMSASAQPATAAAAQQSITEEVTGNLLKNGVQRGNFEGTVEITELSREGRGLVASGRLVGETTRNNGTVRAINKQFQDVPVDIVPQAAQGGGLLAQQQPAGCAILNLDLGPLDLNLLGLQIDLSQVLLDITALPGPGNLLGNLLCAVVGLLDGSGTLGRLVSDILLGIVNRFLG